jgi:uncharacterized protein YxjI
MRYLMREKVFSFGDDFQIKDQNDRAAFVVNGKVFSLANQLSFQDLDGNTLLSIKQQLMSWGPTYVILRGEETVAVVKKEIFHIFKYRFTIDLTGGAPMDAEGGFSDHEYVVAREGSPVATISKQWFAMSDTYGVDIAQGEDDVLLLAITVVIDMVCHPDQRN